MFQVRVGVATAMAWAADVKLPRHCSAAAIVSCNHMRHHVGSNLKYLCVSPVKSAAAESAIAELWKQQIA